MAWSRLLPCFVGGQDGQTPWLLECRSSKTFILITVSAAVFTDIFLYAVIVPVIPFTLHSRAGVAEDEVQLWVSTLVAVYGGALLIAAPLCGYIADQVPTRRLPLLCGLMALTGATILLQLGTSIAVLIVGRVLQGISAAVVWVVGLALLSDTVSSSEIGEAMGWIGTSMSIAILVAPLLGGIVLEKGGYAAVFAMAYGLLGTDIVLRFMIIERKEAVTREKPRAPATSDGSRNSHPPPCPPPWPIPPPAHPGDEKLMLRMALRIDTTGGVALPHKSHPDASPLSISLPTTPASVASSFFPTEPLPPPPPKPRYPPIITLLGSRRLLCALWGVIVQAALLTAFDSTIPLYVQEIFGWDSIGAGLIFLPLLLPSVLNPVIGRLVDRYGPRWFAAAAFFCAAPFLVLLRYVYYNSLHQKVLLCALLVLLGLCIDLMVGPLMAEVTWIVEEKERGSPGLFGTNGAYAQAYGLFNMAYAAGCLIGPLWGGMVTERAGWGTMTWTLALLSGITAAPVMLWCGGSLFAEKKDRRKSTCTAEAAGARGQNSAESQASPASI